MAGPGLTQTAYPTGRLSIESASLGYLPLNGPAWNAYNLLPLWTAFGRRGRNRLLPTAAGVIPYRRRSSEVDVLVDFAVVGECDRNGTAYADPWVGLETNLQLLHTQLLEDPGTTAGTRNARLTMPSGVDRSAAVHVLGLEDAASIEGENQMSGAHGVLWLGRLSLSIPAGRLS